MTRTKSRKFTLTGAASLLALSLATGTAYAQEKEFDIEAQPLAKALLDFNEQSGLTVAAPRELVADKRSSAVQGEMEPEEALEKILSGSGLESNELSTGAYTITLASTEVTEPAPQPFRVAQLYQEEDPREVDPPTTDEDDERVEDTIIVTGTNIRGVENPTVPVIIFDREDIDLSGAATVDEFLRTIPQNFGSESRLTADSANPNSVSAASGDFTQGASIDLRGLGAGTTLTLLNGRRLSGAGRVGAIDVSVIPLGAIERVDVLTDGATAIYGSDAVGGVVNFVTRQDFEGFDVNARYGSVTDGSREDFGVGGAGGFSWSSGGGFAAVDYQEQTPLLAAERDEFVDLAELNEGATFGSDFDRLSVVGGFSQDLGAKARVAVDVLYSDREAESFRITTIDPSAFVSEQEALSVNSRIEYDLTENIVASLFFDYGRNRVDNERTSFDALGEIDFVQNDMFENDLYVFEGQISGKALDLPGGSVSFSVGGLFREEQYERISFVDFQNREGSRDVSAAYAEALVPIVGEANEIPFVKKLELSLAGRYEDYSDVGDSFDPKLGLYWEIDDQLLLRASYTESFRAPDLDSLNDIENYIIAPLPGFLFTAVEPPSPVVNVLLFNGTNPNLRPERAESWSAGFAYEPDWADGLSIRGNYFTIDYTDRLESISVFEPIQDPAFRILLDLDPSTSDVQQIVDRAQFGAIVENPFDIPIEDIQAIIRGALQNVAERDVSGFDLGVNFSRDTELGTFAADVNASYLFDYIARLTPITPSSDQLNTRYRPVDLRVRSSVSWSNDGLTLFAAANYVDSYRDNINPSIANSIDSWTTVDFSIAYNVGSRLDHFLTDNTRVGLSVTNVFDENPPFVATTDGLNFDPTNADPFGRQISFTISKAF